MPAPDDSTLEITPADTAAWAAEPDSDLVLIDCREQDEWDLCHLDGAILAPLSNFAELAATRLPSERPLVVYCHHGMRSLRATQWLRQRGHRAWSLAGGIDRWAEEIAPEMPRY